MRLIFFTRSYINVVILFGFILLLKTRSGICNPITNSNLNEHIREFAPKDDNISSSNVQTLQKQDPKRYTNLASFQPIHFKDVPDSKQSSSNNGRGLVNKDYAGFALHDYEEYPHVNFGYDYHTPDSHHHGYDHHDFGHQYGHYDGHYVGHHKHYNHALAAKAVLWPIAGIALLGAAAALVTNPILLQLGVASGKRRRRNTEEITGAELSAEITEWRPLIKRNGTQGSSKTSSNSTNNKLLQRKAKRNQFSATQRTRTAYKRNPTTKSPIEHSNPPLNTESDEVNFVPIPIKTKYDKIY